MKILKKNQSLLIIIFSLTCLHLGSCTTLRYGLYLQDVRYLGTEQSNNLAGTEYRLEDHKLDIVTSSGMVYNDLLIKSINSDTIIFFADKKAIGVPVDSIEQLIEKGGTKVANGLIIGAAGGAFLGFLIGSINVPPKPLHEDLEDGLQGMVTGLVVGGTVGGFIGYLNKEKKVYDLSDYKGEGKIIRLKIILHNMSIIDKE